MSRTIRSQISNPNSRTLKISPKQLASQIESAKDQGVKVPKVKSYASDDFDVSAYNEKPQLNRRLELDGTVSYYLRNGEFLVNLTKLESNNFNWQMYFPKFA